MNDLTTRLAADAARVEVALDQLMPDDGELATAMRYAVLNGGKRLRAHLVYESARIFDVGGKRADEAAAAIEMVHAYSLVHDDLPAMDDDDLRRGQPTVHVKWNEWTAILVGDGLQSLAMKTLAQKSAPLAGEFASAAGEMVRGQYLDLAAERAETPLNLNEIKILQAAKTGALITWSACFGAHSADADTDEFATYAHHLGLGFQIWDDVLDVTATSDTLGKTAGKDVAAGKATFISHLGLDGARAAAEREIDDAKSALDNHPSRDGLRALADFVITRSH